MGAEKPSPGEEIEKKLTLANQISIVHKQGSAGCLRSTACCSCWCPQPTSRSFKWIAEMAIINNKSFFVAYDPTTCAFCETSDISSMELLDQGKFLPWYHGAGSPCGPRGYATQEDLFKGCFCVDCSRVYKCLLHPFCGEFVCTVPCENGSRGFGNSTIVPCLIPCVPCLVRPVGCCLKDSTTYRTVLMKQVARAQGVELTDNQRRAVPPPAQGMTR